MEIKFENIHYSTDFSLSADVIRSDFDKQKLYFDLPEGTLLDDELIALAFSTLCGGRYQEIYMDLSVSKSCKFLIESFCKAKLYLNKVIEEIFKRPRGNANVLSFSGGFDSLAAKALLSDDTDLVSLDFGGKFERERVFFEQYITNIVKTNLVDLKLNRNHWSFMASGMILLRSSLSIKNVTFGSIMASSIPSIIKNGELASNALPHFDYLGISIYNPLAGVTEIGALSIALKSSQKNIIDSLKSLANPKEGKFFRKSLALNVFCEFEGVFDIEVIVPKPKEWYVWGRSYADDLSTLYVLKKAGRLPVEKSYIGGIPDSVVQQVDQLNLGFFLKYNPEAYTSLDAAEASAIFDRLSQYGLLPYTRVDFKELGVVNSLIQNPEFKQ